MGGSRRRRSDPDASDYRIDLATGCWVWQRARTTAGYGTLTLDAKKTIRAKGIIKGQPVRYLRGHAGSWQESGGYAIDAATGCWVWQRSTSVNGYGQAWYNGKLYRAHRLFYEPHVGPIPDGLQIDHKCSNRLCVNPEHLEPVTAIENSRRAKRKSNEN